MTAPQYPQSPGNDPAYGAPNPGGYPAAGYPGAGYPGGPMAPAVKPKAPGTITAAFIIYLLSAIAAAASVAVLFTDDGKRQLRQALTDANINGVDVDSLVNTTRTAAGVLAVVLIVLYVIFDLLMRAGRNWARIVLTVVSALSIISSFTGSLGAARGTVSWVGLILSILAIVLMYLPVSNAYFAAVKLSRSRA